MKPNDGKLEPVMMQSLPDKSSLAQERSSDIDALLLDIFNVTGNKVTKDDPILVAALIQSSLVKQAGNDAANSLQNAVIQAVAELADAVKVEREQASILDKTVANAFQQITDGAKKVGDQELTTLQTRFSRMASETLDQVRKEGSRQAPGGLTWKITSALFGGVAIGLIAGAFIGKAIAPKITNDQVRLMHNGTLLDASWQKLPKSAHDIIEASNKDMAIPKINEVIKDKKP